MAGQESQSLIELTLEAFSWNPINGGGERVFFRVPHIPQMLLAVPTNLKFGQSGQPLAPAIERVSELLTSTHLSTPLMIESFFNGLKPSTPGVPLAAIYHPYNDSSLPYVSFMREIKGKSFFDLFLDGNFSIEKVLTWPPETFEHLLRQARSLTEAHHSIDNVDGNIMLENPRNSRPILRIIDTHPGPDEMLRKTLELKATPQNDFYKVMGFFSLYEANPEQRLSFYKLLVDAAEKVGFGGEREGRTLPADFPEEYRERLKAIPPLNVDYRSPVYPSELTATGKLAITEPSFTLASYLERIRNANCGRVVE